MKLKVTPYKQKDELSCGPTCLRMVLAYYGLKVTEDEIIKSAGGIKKGYHKGVLATDLGLAVEKFGLGVTLFSYNTYIMNPADKTKKRMINKLKQIRPKEKERYRAQSIIKFLKSEGEYKVKAPDVKDLYKFIRKKVPLIIYLSTSAFYGKQEKGLGHTVVITGFDKNKFHYNDPVDGKEHQVSKDELLFAWHNNVLNSTAYLLVVEEK